MNMQDAVRNLRRETSTYAGFEALEALTGHLNRLLETCADVRLLAVVEPPGEPTEECVFVGGPADGTAHAVPVDHAIVDVPAAGGFQPGGNAPTTVTRHRYVDQGERNAFGERLLRHQSEELRVQMTGSVAVSTTAQEDAEDEARLAALSVQADRAFLADD